jgi:beta-glucanase (GH16 family)
MNLKRSTCMLASALVACATLALSPASSGAVTKHCGSAVRSKPLGLGGSWVCTFGDDFNGTALKTENWQAMNTAATGFSQAGECYVNDPSHIAVGGGMLAITATKLPSPQACGPITSQYQTGMVFTKDRFAQTYGRFQARVKFPSGTGVQSAFWMWPEDMFYGKHSGEIDIAEAYGDYPDLVSPHIHVIDDLGVKQSPGINCKVAGASGGFHKYTLVWLPELLKFRYDGRTCMALVGPNLGLPLSASDPFNKPFFMLLQLALGYGPNAPTPSSAFPAKLLVDYVRAWR